MLPRVRPGGRRAGGKPLRRALTAYAAAAVALVAARRRVGVPRPATLLVSTSVPFVVGALLPRGRVQYAGVWVTYMWLFKVAWEVPYDRREKLRRHLHVDYALRVDRAIGGGAVPSARLQRALRDPPRLTAADYALTYLGEHYVLDVVVGLAVAETGWRAKPALLPLVRLGMRAVRQLERLTR